MYWYHPDYLGSSSFITGIDGEVNQNIEYFPSGETFVENHLNSYNTPYKFNSKELDDETGYYYYGARYYNPRVSLWLNVDPLAEDYPGWSPYNYVLQSPVRYIDPDGMGVYGDYYGKNGSYLGSDGKNDKKVYVASGKNSDGTFQNAKLLTWASGRQISKDAFEYLSSVLFGEGSGTPLEAAAIYNTMENRASVKGHSVYEEASPKEGVYGASEASRKNYLNASDQSTSKLNARAGLIMALQNPNNDYSNGAYFWHGEDFDNDPMTGKQMGVTGNGAYRQFYKKGFLFTDPKHDLWKQGNNKVYTKTNRGSWSFMYKSTATHGKTTFMRYTDRYLRSLFINSDGTSKRATELGTNPK